jgi:hypothetical protein
MGRSPAARSSTRFAARWPSFPKHARIVSGDPDLAR